MDNYYESMIQDIINNASDREQLIIISRLVSALKEWQLPAKKGGVEELYYENLSEIQSIIDDTLEKEREMREKMNRGESNEKSNI